MKKIILCMGIIALLTGCGEKEEMMTCTKEITSNGLSNKTEYLVTYKSDEVKHVKITYNYSQETKKDGVGTGTDGTTSDESSDNDGVVGGTVGDITSDIIGGIYNTIIDLSGLRDMHTNQINNTNIEGFTTKVENNTSSSYKVIYDLDLTKISDTDIGKFNVSRSYDTIKESYINQGLTCK